MSSSRSSISNSNSKSNLSELSNKDPLSRFGAEVRGYAMAAVILEEWLQELAAIAQEQSVIINDSSISFLNFWKKRNYTRFHRNKSKKTFGPRPREYLRIK